MSSLSMYLLVSLQLLDNLIGMASDLSLRKDQVSLVSALVTLDRFGELRVWACRFLCGGRASVISAPEPVKASGQAQTRYSRVYVVSYDI